MKRSTKVVRKICQLIHVVCLLPLPLHPFLAENLLHMELRITGNYVKWIRAKQQTGTSSNEHGSAEHHTSELETNGR